MSPKILITAATGKTGYEAAANLLKEGYHVRILTRAISPKAKALEDLGAEIALGDITNYVQVSAALSNISTVYYCYPIAKGMPEAVSLFIKAATENRVTSVVFMGQWLAEFPNQQSLLTNDIKKSYELLKQSSLNVVYYNPGFFAENIVALTESIVQLGIMPTPFGEGKCPWISAADQGRVIAALLKNPKPYYGKKIHPTGPRSIDAKEMAAIYSTITGGRVKLMPVSDDMFMKAVLAAAKEFGYDDFVALQTVFYMQEFRKNRFAEGGPTDVVKTLTGREPEDFEQIARGFINNSPYGKPSFSKKLSALAAFIKLMFVKLPSKKALEALNK